MRAGTTSIPFAFSNSFARELEGLYVPWQGAPIERPVLLALSAGVADQLGIAIEALRAPDVVAVLAGSVTPAGAEPIAQAYAGHQFGGYSPRLGDGRALLLGELIDTAGRRQDLHLKGSGRTPFARGGDGKAAIGPMLREFAISEAMAALGIPTARALAVVATNETVMREVPLPGAVLARVAESHLRVGSFEYAARADRELLRRLADYAIARHDPQAAHAAEPYVAFFDGVVARQAELVARWMLTGFVHGVMNTDNMTISGQTIDYGPCAFMDRYDQATVFSSIDRAGRYAYGNQPLIAQWDLARLGEALLGLLQPGGDAALNAALDGFQPRFRQALLAGYAAKLGLPAGGEETEQLIDDLLGQLQLASPDFTGVFRALSATLRGRNERWHALAIADPAGLEAWRARWLAALGAQGIEHASAAAAMDAVNPVYIPRNHLVQEALDAATSGDLQPFAAMLGVLEQPFTERPGLDAWAAPAPAGAAPVITYCGT